MSEFKPVPVKQPCSDCGTEHGIMDEKGCHAALVRQLKELKSQKLKTHFLGEEGFLNLRDAGVFKLILDHPDFGIYMDAGLITVHIPKCGAIQIVERESVKKEAMRELIPVGSERRNRPCTKVLTLDNSCGKGPVVWESGELRLCFEHALEMEEATKRVQDQLGVAYRKLEVVP